VTSAVDRVTIVGAGGIGCALGHALSLGNVDVTMVEVDRTKLEWGSEHGIGLDGEPPQRARFVAFDDWRPAGGQPILLATKCYDNRVVLDLVSDDHEVIPVQNGFDTLLVDRVEIEGIASFVSECLPGRTHTRVTRPGDLHLGFCADNGGRSLPPRIEGLVDILDRCGRFEVKRVPAVLSYKNAKLLYNAAISPIAAVAGLDNGQLLTIARARRLFFGLLRENHEILTGAGAPLARIGPFHPDTVSRILRVPLLARVMAIPFARTLRGTYCSMAGDLPGGPTELDNYNGYLLELAGDREVPLNREVYRLAKDVEEGGFDPSIEWLDGLLGRLNR
jgi:2-dehydropantoate 2-reductase